MLRTGMQHTAASLLSTRLLRRGRVPCMRALSTTRAAAGDGPHVVELQPEAFAKLREEAHSAGAGGLQCLDVREEWEHQTASLAGFQLRPLSRMSEWAPSIENDFDKSQPVYVLCHHGVRSRSAANWLVSLGWVGAVYNISGGIDAWTRRVDESVPMY
jgi:rhodanese-related sulfurtransferase